MGDTMATKCAHPQNAKKPDGRKATGRYLGIFLNENAALRTVLRSASNDYIGNPPSVI
jgi:hypothetical protein